MSTICSKKKSPGHRRLCEKKEESVPVHDPLGRSRDRNVDSIPISDEKTWTFCFLERTLYEPSLDTRSKRLSSPPSREKIVERCSIDARSK